MKFFRQIPSQTKRKLLLFRTSLLVWSLRCRGRRIRVGRNTIIHPGARIRPDQGIIIIGENCSIFSGAMIRTWSGSIVIGNDVGINEYAVLHGIGRLYIGNDTRIASHVVIIPANHSFDDLDIPIRKQALKVRGIYIGADVWIGAGAKILAGVRLGKGSVIGAGAVVTKSTCRQGVYVGNPARFVRLRGR